MIKSLQSLRAVGAIMIFIHHFGFDGPIAASFGDCAVNWFMMLSGFVLCAAYENRTPRSVKHFLSGRFTRIAPLYYVSLAIMLLINKFEIGIKPLVASLLMIQSWFPNMDIFFSLNLPAWFVSDLMFCYLLFIPLHRLLTSGRKLFRRLILGFALAAFAVVTVSVPQPWELFVIYIFPPMQLASFVTGMLLWQLVVRLRNVRLAPFQANLLILSAVWILIIFIGAYDYFPARLTLSSYWWIPTALLLVILTLTDRTDCLATRILHWRPLMMLGNAGLSFYLLHLPWILLTRMALKAVNVELPLPVELPLSILALALLSVIIHRRFYPKTH